MLIVILCVILGLGLAFLIDAGFVWIICWALNAIGVHHIGSWRVEFSWPLVLIFLLISALISGFFAAARGN